MAGQADRGVIGLSQHARRDALSGAAPLKPMNLVAYEQLEEAPHVELHVVGREKRLGPRLAACHSGESHLEHSGRLRESCAWVSGTPSLSTIWAVQ